tara:strand:+ start:272 stop:898 length:627 start_codon:yes stop_codon:yes gene_type:complete
MRTSIFSILLLVTNCLVPKGQVTYFGTVPKNTPDYIFSKHRYDQILDMFDILQEYSNNKINQTQGVDRRMYQGMSTNLRNGQYYATRMRDEDSTYLAWTPLNKDNIMIRYSNKPVRNDNADISFRKVPLYFIFLESKEKELCVTRIIQNPSIQVNINIKLIRKHLEELAETSNKKLNILPLLLYDSGRWYFEFSLGYNLTQTRTVELL